MSIVKCFIENVLYHADAGYTFYDADCGDDLESCKERLSKSREECCKKHPSDTEIARVLITPQEIGDSPSYWCVMYREECE